MGWGFRCALAGATFAVTVALLVTPAGAQGSGNCGRIVGVWTWHNNISVVVKPDGTADASNGGQAILACEGGIYEFKWQGVFALGHVSRMTLSADGKQMSGSGPWGVSESAVRKGAAPAATAAAAPGAKTCEQKIIGTWAVNDGSGRPFEIVVSPDGTMIIRWILTETVNWSCSGNTYQIGIGGAGGSDMTLSTDSNLLTGTAWGLGRLFGGPISASRKGAAPATQAASAPSGSGTADAANAGAQPSLQDNDDCRQKDDEELRIASCTRIIKDTKIRGSDRAVAHYNRADVWNSRGDIDRAIADYTEAIRLDPKDPAAYYNRAVAWRAKGDLDRAIVDYDHAINPDRPSRRQRQP
jgi:TPR repeat